MRRCAILSLPAVWQDRRGDPARGPSVAIEKAYSCGRSQTGRCIRDFLYRGFNADAEGRRVFDGVLPHVAGAGREVAEGAFCE